ncbi:serine hydrolase domain-containing protein [Jeongeupia naejangsanensis]|uniref:Beta-lactamase family protein n=1 Tax=Jeongeupia naejangsanensis TaxID=613195 RepID=A0ABS2BKU8_9NEIS|nr:serine hydrolase domain-containing protein [Jeongeupia naejangsanensis]MBM3116238.1 beta-lactamase family protein [Jeongeupia naejangsanensis]
MDRHALPAINTLTNRLDTVIDGALAKARLVGTVVVVARDGETVYRRAAGLADREQGVPMREDALFRLASLTKPIVSTAALALVEQGRLSLHSPLADVLPDFTPRLPDGRPATLAVHHLLTHTAGFSYGFFEAADGPYHRAGVSDGLDAPGLSMAEQLQRIASVPLLFEPGSGWRYSVGTDVLGAVIARVTGQTLPEAIAALVTGPLGMDDTAFDVRDRTRLVPPYADGVPAGSPPVRMDGHTIVPFIDPGLAGLAFAPDRIFDPASFPSGGGGMVGSAGDFLRFLESIRTDRSVISPAMSQALRRNQTGGLLIDTRGPGWGFGYGGSVLLDPVAAATPQSPGTWQWGGAYGHGWFVDPVEKLTVIALTNTTVEGLTGRFGIDVRDAVYGT